VAWKQLVAPAIQLARDGFEVDAVTARGLARPIVVARLQKSPASVAIWFRDGAPVAEGTVVKIPDLAAVLERIAERGAAGFYTGPTAAAIAAEMKSGGGLITLADLERYRAVWRDPLRFPYRGHSIVSMPPPSSGGLVLALTARMLANVEVGKLAWYGPDHVHRLVETWKRGFAMRNQVLGDPAFVKDLPIAKLTSPAYADRLAAAITDKATPSQRIAPLLEGDHTTNLCVVDGAGLAVALTTTLNTGFGSGITVAGAGFLMNNEMDDFTAKPGSPNTFGLVQGSANKIEPGKRMLSSMSPTIVENARGEVVLLAGAGGGPRIITAVWQTLSNVIDFGKSVEDGVARSRVHHQHLPDLLRTESASIERATDEELRRRGHAVSWGETRRDFAVVTAIGRAADGWHGISDPRAGGGAMGDE
jgi:gamma-glutamyltranspeptidase/glutathione hydrolase